MSPNQMCVLFKGKATAKFGGGTGVDPGFGNEFVRSLGAKSPQKAGHFLQIATMTHFE